jgi:hypothetical protein
LTASPGKEKRVGKPVEIICSACGADTLLKREAVYEGFQKTGERLLCASCGHEYPGEDEVPFKEKKSLAVFEDSDRAETVEVFREDEKGRNCRHCKHYVVNPFVQRCAVHQKLVEATDICDDFEKKEEKKEEQREEADAE